MPNLTDALTALFVDHGVRLIQTADGLSRDANDRLRQLTDAIVALILASGVTTEALAEIRSAVMATYEQISAQSIASVAELAPIEARFVTTTVNRAVGIPLLRTPRLTVSDPYVQGATLKDWWNAQAEDTAAKIANTIRAAVAKDYTADQIAELLTGPTSPLTAAQRNAVSLTHTAVQRMAMDARHVTLQANSRVVEGLQIVATLDSRVCALCLAYDGATYDLDGEPLGDTTLPFNGGPEFHFNCRCATVPIFRRLANVQGADGEPGTGMTAEEWLDSKTEAEQDEILGKGRANLYRKGSLTLRDLLSGTGTQLSLAQLREKYNHNE
jgi:hypothetical protein